ncbi:MAG: 16S rRNA (adenine(1518)-N(6)/adenine(1519)-N(6))-dimethyltransferase RsmA [Patescibacteria group bacterium]|jgi:16S rRNA (adenine1518-N6/adenine1519-N6)-dimethyltransferase
MIDLTDLKTIKSLLTYYNVSAQKNLGQHFLIDPEILDKMLAAAELSKGDFVVEIGPGFGVMTLPMADLAGRVLAVETDKKVLEILKALGSGYSNLDILPSNILKLDSRYIHDRYKTWAKVKQGKTSYKLVSNLPYYITSAILKLFLETDLPPDLIVVMVQKEVAERIVAEPGELSLLGISVQFFGKPELISLVPRTSFWPKPEVTSAIIRIRPFKQPPYDIDNIKLFFRIVKAGFGEKRKQLHNSLSGGLWLDDTAVQELLEEIGVDPKMRPQDLSLSEWAKIYHRLKQLVK